jgi:EAL domain-containing protein (putative c-di-GMP-specific phosphodiesterase class I)
MARSSARPVAAEGVSSPAFRPLEIKVAELEAELERERQQLRAICAAARRGNEAKGEFLSRIGYDLRTSLNNIIGYGEILLEDAERERRDEHVADLKKVSAAGRHLLEVVTEVFDVFGLAVARDSGDGLDQLLEQAHAMLRRARDSFGPTANPPPGAFAIRTRREMESELRNALDERQFELHYQPLVMLDTLAIVGCEALLRWRHPEKGLVAPDRFIKDAERSGLILPIGAWAMRTACEQAASWPNGTRVAVNVSPAQLRSEAFIDVVLDALRATKLGPNRLELEVTESMFIAADEQIRAHFQTLRREGVRISLDDFGTGYSSLGYLKRFAFDTIKIDRCFVADLGACDEAMAIVHAIMTLSERLGLSVIGEGVETAEQAAWLRSAGCAEAQGWHFGRAQPAETIQALLRRRALPELAAPPH